MPMARGWLALFGVATVLFSSCGSGTSGSAAAVQTVKRAVAVILSGQRTLPCNSYAVPYSLSLTMPGIGTG